MTHRRIQDAIEALTDALASESPGMPETSRRHLLEALGSMHRAEAIQELATEGWLREPSRRAS